MTNGEFPEFNINPDDLAAEYIKLPGTLAEWALKSAALRRDYELAKMHVKQIASVLDIEYRGMVVGKTTERAIAASVECDRRYINAQEKVVTAKFLVDEAAAVMEGLKCKVSMLISFGAQVRAEIPSY